MITQAQADRVIDRISKGNIPFWDGLPPPEVATERPHRHATRPASPRRAGQVGTVPTGAAVVDLVRDRDLLPLAALVCTQASVALGRDRAQLALQLAVAVEAPGVERSVGDRCLDRAARLGVVRAVGEPALAAPAPRCPRRGWRAPSSPSHSCASRRPGVSMIIPPPAAERAGGGWSCAGPRPSGGSCGCASRPRRRCG